MINKEEIFDFLHKEFGFKNLIDLEAELNICSIVNPTLKKTLTDEYGFDFRKGDSISK